MLERAFDRAFEYFGASSENEKLFFVVACGVVLGYAASLLLLVMRHAWIVDAHGRPMPHDFLAIWVAGRQVLNGAPLAVYDPAVQHAAEAAMAGREPGTLLLWLYPPVFLFVATLLACIPYTVSFVVWSLSTLALHAGVAASIARQRIAFVVALGAPWVLIGLAQGQNGFLASAIIGASLLCLDRRPILSGALLGFLCFKPQYGILFPLALAMGGYWRAFLSAAISTAALCALSAIMFGLDTWSAFFHSLPLTLQSHVINGGISWRVLQSAYGLVRAMGGTVGAAWTVQFVQSLAVVLGVALSWRASIPQSLKAALLAAGATLVVPYILFYDLTILTIALAFLYQHRKFDTFEIVALSVAVLISLIHLRAPIPSAYFACLAVFVLSMRRFYAAATIQPAAHNASLS